MLPTVRPGDRLVVRRLEFSVQFSEVLSEVQAGQIVLYCRGGGLVAHRVVRRAASPDGDRLVTRGDSLLQDDSPVNESEVIGVVASVTRRGRIVSTELNMWRRAAAWVLARWGFATRVMLHLGKAKARRVAWA
jgi:antitoxin (DNA-binding transcriptional repressor) of toxin-antitoxin stability system